MEILQVKHMVINEMLSPIEVNVKTLMEEGDEYTLVVSGSMDGR